MCVTSVTNDDDKVNKTDHWLGMEKTNWYEIRIWFLVCDNQMRTEEEGTERKEEEKKNDNEQHINHILIVREP